MTQTTDRSGSTRPPRARRCPTRAPEARRHKTSIYTIRLHRACQAEGRAFSGPTRLRGADRTARSTTRPESARLPARRPASSSGPMRRVSAARRLGPRTSRPPDVCGSWSSCTTSGSIPPADAQHRGEVLAIGPAAARDVALRRAPARRRAAAPRRASISSVHAAGRRHLGGVPDQPEAGDVGAGVTAPRSEASRSASPRPG